MTWYAIKGARHLRVRKKAKALRNQVAINCVKLLLK